MTAFARSKFLGAPSLVAHLSLPFSGRALLYLTSHASSVYRYYLPRRWVHIIGMCDSVFLMCMDVSVLWSHFQLQSPGASTRQCNILHAPSTRSVNTSLHSKEHLEIQCKHCATCRQIQQCHEARIRAHLTTQQVRRLHALLALLRFVVIYYTLLAAHWLVKFVCLSTPFLEVRMCLEMLFVWSFDSYLHCVASLSCCNVKILWCCCRTFISQYLAGVTAARTDQL
jgi:hypothetical protein